MIRQTIAFTIAACTLLACKKDDPEIKPQPKETYFPLAIGNQWVYDTYAVSYDDKETLLPSLRDTVTITKDTLIDGKSYFLFRSSFKNSNEVDLQTHQMFLMSNIAMRDSSGYLVGPYGSIHYSSDFQSHDTIKTYVGLNTSYKQVMTDPNKEMTVPAGTFKVVALETHVWINELPNSRKVHHQYFAKNVGPIYNHAFYHSDGRDAYRKKLVAYHLK